MHFFVYNLRNWQSFFCKIEEQFKSLVKIPKAEKNIKFIVWKIKNGFKLNKYVESLSVFQNDPKLELEVKIH